MELSGLHAAQSADRTALRPVRTQPNGDSPAEQSAAPNRILLIHFPCIHIQVASIDSLLFFLTFHIPFASPFLVPVPVPVPVFVSAPILRSIAPRASSVA